MSPIPGADLPLGVEEGVYHAPAVGVELYHTLRIKHHHALGVEQAMGTATNCDPRVGVIRDQGAGVTHIPSVELDIPDLVLGAECLTQQARS